MIQLDIDGQKTWVSEHTVRELNEGVRTALADGIHFVNPEAPFKLRRLAQNVQHLAVIELPFGGFGFYHAADREDFRAFHTVAVLSVRNFRVIGLAVVRERGSRRSIEVLWVARDHRRKRHATSMIHALKGQFGLSPGDFLYTRPFTDAGLGVLKNGLGLFSQGGEIDARC